MDSLALTRRRAASIMTPCADVPSAHQESIMGKYVIGWLLGVPAVVLIGIYLVSNVF